MFKCDSFINDYWSFIFTCPKIARCALNTLSGLFINRTYADGADIVLPTPET